MALNIAEATTSVTEIPDQYRELATQTLKILQKPYAPDDDLPKLAERIRSTMPFAINSTDVEIRLIAQTLAAQIENRADVHFIQQLLDDLEFEVGFLPFE